MRIWPLSTSGTVYEVSVHATGACRCGSDFLLSRFSQSNCAVRVKRQIERSAAALALSPYLGVALDRSPEFRALRVRRYPYYVYYRIRGHAVWIVHIRHTS